MPLFKIDKERKVSQLHKSKFSTERELQSLCEQNLDTLLGVRFIASEFPTGEKHGGRIDSLGLDQNNYPVIIEYKWSENQNIINQGLFYMDWLSDHKGDFEIAAQKALGAGIKINWDQPRLVLLAESFSKYDTYAVNKIGQNIELKTYRLYSDGLLYIEDLYTPVVTKPLKGKPKIGLKHKEYPLEGHLMRKSTTIRELFHSLDESILSLGESVERKTLKHYVGYKTHKNFCELVVQAKKIWVYIDISRVDLHDPKGLSEDCSRVGRWATGNLRFSIRSPEDMKYALSLIKQSYDLTL